MEWPGVIRGNFDHQPHALDLRMQGADLGVVHFPRNGDGTPPDRAGAYRHIFATVTGSIKRMGQGIGSWPPHGGKPESLLPELAAIACFLILPWIGITAALHHEYYHAEAAAVQSTGNLAQALEESTRRTIGQIDYILLSARAMQAAQGKQFDFHNWVRTQTLADKMTAQIAITDRAGQVIDSTMPRASSVSVADRPHFRAQVDPAHDDLFISLPVTGRVSGLETIQFSRKLLDADGAFAGVIVFSLSSVELARFYEALGLGNGFVSVLSGDGTILARGPWVSGLNGSSIKGNADLGDVLDHPSGSIRLRATPGQVAEIVSFRHLQEYPLIVMVGFGTDAVFGPYRSLMNNALLSGAAITLAVALVGFFWVQQKRRSLVSRRALTVTLDTISQGILMVDGQGGVSVINPRVLDLLAWPDERPEAALKLVASRAIELIPGIDGANAIPGMSRIAGGLRRDSKFETTLENGTIIEVRTHVLPDGGFVQTYTDVTEQRLAHAQVQHLAHHDALTGLANRVELRERISDIVDRNVDPQALTALVMIDLDGFKGINDTFGHDAGDKLLVKVSQRLKALVRVTDVVGRLGGDEFVILAVGLQQPEDIVPLAKRVLRRLADPIQVHGHQVRIGASVGIAFHPQDGRDVDTLFKHADVALYDAKTGGRGMYRCFDKQLTQAVTEHRRLESELRRALDDEALEVHFQPKFNSRSLEIVGFEALARWRHPTRGFISPDVFIRIAEDCGLINRLGRWILEQACKGVAAWNPRLPVAVNVSVRQLHDGGLKDDIAAVLRQTGLGSEHLEIEVTESVMADDDQTVLGNLRAIKAMGIRIALDDFGTGYSSLSYLRRFAFDKIKIDKSFVQGQTDDPGVRVILDAILNMCHNLGLATIAEGVETPEQLALLRDHGCTEIQGYLLGRPMPGEKIQDFICSHLRVPDKRDAQDAEVSTMSGAPA
jgi:diguanylate cyclase (GGDEF)-like protein